MPNQIPNESYPNPATEQLLAAALNQVRSALGVDLADKLLPEGTALLGLRTELFQSPTLAAGQDAMPGSYPPDDRSLIILTLQEDRQVFLIGGKINPADPLDIGSALGGGVDPRATDRTAYAYNGGQTFKDQIITEYLQDGSTNTYTGQYGDPEILLSHVRDSLGELVAFETVGLDPSF